MPITLCLIGQTSSVYPSRVDLQAGALKPALVEVKRLGSSEECLATALRFSNTQVTSADWLFSANIACQHFRLICVNVCFAKKNMKIAG